ncbi:MAG: penicillin-binding protein 2 [Chloroflexi bacterium]|nr:penicillin-binding protein 2 [Chloroflexota bacterium]
MGVLAGNRRKRWRSEPQEVADAKRELQLKLWLLRIGILVAFAVLTGQLARLQLVRGDQYQQRAQFNQLRIEPVIPSRGLIYDRNGIPVVENVPGFSAAIVAADVPKERQLEIVGALERMLGVPALETSLKIDAARASNDPFTPLIIKDGLDRDTAFYMREQLGELPGVQVLVQSVRRYPAGEELAHILGYTGRIDSEEYAELKNSGYINSDYLGKAGVEAAYEEYLRGATGQKEIEKDAIGRELRTLGETPSRPGYDLVLSVDLDLQKKVTELTKAAAGDNQAAVVVMDVHTGEVLSLVSLPQYDDNIFSGKTDEVRLEQYLNDPRKPLVNHALAEQYAPGSIFKQITGSAALEEGVANPSTTITSNGFINVPNQYDPSVIYTFRDWRVLGTLDFYGGVAMSSDVYFYYLSGGYHEYGENFDGLGVERLARYARQFGLGRKTGIDIAGEADGVVPDPAWKEETFPGDIWVLGDTYNMGIGQGFLAVTPLQMARVVTAVANGGTLLTPRVVREVRDSQGHVIVPNEPKIEGSVGISDTNLAIVREAMRQAVQWGSANPAQSSLISIAGKTGTAEFGQRFADGSYETHGWFSGFAPADNPQIAITVFLERGVGATHAAPLASKILEYYLTRQQQRADGASATPSGVTP